VAFRGVMVGSLLGDAVAVQVRGVDYLAVTATVALGVLAVADVVFLNIRERAAELATIRSFGWRESSLARLVVTEGVVIGAVGSLAGAGLGLAAAAEFAGSSRPGWSRPLPWPPPWRPARACSSPSAPRCCPPGRSVGCPPRT